jgi:hypothetical protein
VNRSLGSRYVLHDVLGRGAMGEVFHGTGTPSEDVPGRSANRVAGRPGRGA